MLLLFSTEAGSGGIEKGVADFRALGRLDYTDGCGHAWHWAQAAPLKKGLQIPISGASEGQEPGEVGIAWC